MADGNAVRYQACFVQKNTFVSYKNHQKLLLQEQHFLTPVCTKSFVGSGFAPGRGREEEGGSSSFALGRKRKVVSSPVP